VKLLEFCTFEKLVLKILFENIIFLKFDMCFICIDTKRNLSILGKVLIIKALIIPIFTFIVSSCVNSEKYKKEIESKCFKFIWNGKPDKVKRNTLIGYFEKDKS
jgi:hypothetical protein